MIRVKATLDHKRIRRLIWLVLAVFVLLGYSLQIVAGIVYYYMELQASTTVSSPPVILQNGNVSGASTIYTNSTSAKVNVTAPIWLGGWNNRVKITIDHNDVDSDLSDFPVLIYLSSSSGRNNDDVTCVFDEVGSNSKKIAVTTGDLTAQCYVEVEKWDATGEEAWLWVKVPSISSTTDTDLYLYYDNDQADNTDYVDDTNTGNSVNVWDSSFIMVQHMRDNTTSSTVDSTSNDNDGTKGAAGQPAVTTSGKIDSAQDFDGSDDYISLGNFDDLDGLSEYTISLWLYDEDVGVFDGWTAAFGRGSNGQRVPWIMGWSLQSKLVCQTETSVAMCSVTASANVTDNTWEYWTFTFNQTGACSYKNGGYDNFNAGSGGTVNATDGNNYIGRMGCCRKWNGQIDEVRISGTSRSAAWTKASYESDIDDLLDFGSGESGGWDKRVKITIDHNDIVEAPWLSGWDKRVKLTIDHNDVGTMYSFPLLVYLSGSSGRNNDDVTCVFDEVGSNSKKIAVTADDGTSQCYVEIEKWNVTSEEAWLWVKVDVSSTSDTNLYLYYDNDHANNTYYVGDPNSTPAGNVWGSTYKLVTHMLDDPDTSHVRDSTSNNNDGTKGAAGEPAVTTSGKIDDAQIFDGSDDYINCSTGITDMTYHTITAWVNLDLSSGDDYYAIVDNDITSTYNGTSLYVRRSDGAIGTYLAGSWRFSSTNKVTDDTWAFIAIRGYKHSSSGYLYISKDGSSWEEIFTGDTSNLQISSGASTMIGRWAGTVDYYAHGIIDEVRVISSGLSSNFLKAYYESERDDLLDFGQEDDCNTPVSNFPVLVYLSSSSGRNNDDVTCVFDEVGSNSKKIAVTTDDGTTQCYVEVEKWNATSEEAWLWVKVPSISKTTDTDLYLYYDNDQPDNANYVGDTGSTPAENVWDSNYKMVHHLQYDPSGSAPQEIDSTSNSNDGTSGGSMTSGDLVEGKIDGAIDFDGTDDKIDCGNASSLNNLSTYTWEVFFNASSVGAYVLLLNKYPKLLQWYTGNVIRSVCEAATATAESITVETISVGVWTHVTITYDDGGDRKIHVFINGDECSYSIQDAAVGTLTNDNDGNLKIGYFTDLFKFPFNGTIDEVRISNIVRNAAWIKASNESERDDLVAYGNEEGTSDYDYVLKVVNRVEDSWQVKLQAYDNSSISRLSTTIISIRNTTTTSNQIIVSGGTITQTEGSFFDLPGGVSETLYIKMSNVKASTSGTSYIYAYLKIQEPGTTTYMLYVITFEIN